MEMTSELLLAVVCGLVCMVVADPEYQCPLNKAFSNNKEMEAEMNLKECLMNNYQRNVRPISKGAQNKTHISIDIQKVVLSEMFSNEDYISIDIFSTYKWNDYRLVWTANQNEDITFVYMSPWKLWKPEIVLYDGRAETGDYANYVKAIVRSSGEVTWSPQIRAHAYCKGDYRAFPYDTQKCKFTFKRQIYDEEYVKLDVKKAGEDLGKYVCSSIHTEWSILECKADIEIIKLGNENSHALVLEVKVKRNYRYHVYVIILPSTILALLVLALLWVPHHSNQRFALAGGLLFASLMTCHLLQHFLPLGVSQVPVVVSYLLYIISMITITTIISLITQNIACVDPSNRSVPEIIKKCLLNSMVCRVTGVLHIDDQSDTAKTSFENNNWKPASVKINNNNNNNNNDNNNNVIDSICKQLELLSKSSMLLSTVDNPWIQLSQVLDRLFFYLFFVIFIIVTSVLYGH